MDINKVHTGHRQRMKNKLTTHGARIFDTYELLEMLLYFVIPYKDTNPISKLLLDKFGSLDGVLRASREELLAVVGVGERAADLLGVVSEITLSHDDYLSERPVFDNYHRVGEYFVEYFKNNDDDRIVMALLDSSMQYIDLVKIPGTDYESGAVLPRYFVDAALTAGASVAITAHYHKYGPPMHTHGDKVTEHLIYDELENVGVTLAEQYVVFAGQYYGSDIDFGHKLMASDKLLEFEKSKEEQDGISCV